MQTFTGDGPNYSIYIGGRCSWRTIVAQNTIVSVAGKILQAGYNIEMPVVANTREYFIEDWQYYFPNSIRDGVVEVYINDQLLRKAIHHRWSSTNNSITLTQGVGEVGDKIEIFLVLDGEYAFMKAQMKQAHKDLFPFQTKYILLQIGLGETIEVKTLSNPYTRFNKNKIQ